MRARILKPELFVNEELAALGPLAILLFEGLWCAADREGRLEDRPSRIKAQCLPYFECDPDALLQALHDTGFILRYQVAGKKYIEIINFLRHQKPHLRESASTMPAPPRHGLGSAKVRTRHNLEKTTTDTDLESETESETVTDPDPDLGFDRFWSLYPRKDGKQAARQEWERLTPEERSSVIADIPARLKANWDGRPLDKLPHASTYLHQKRWQDELQVLSPAAARAAPENLSPGSQNLFRAWKEAKAREGSGNDRATGARQGLLAGASDGSSSDPGVDRIAGAGDLRGGT